jgi:hypothetical protein
VYGHLFPQHCLTPGASIPPLRPWSKLPPPPNFPSPFLRSPLTPHPTFPPLPSLLALDAPLPRPRYTRPPLKAGVRGFLPRKFFQIADCRICILAHFWLEKCVNKSYTFKTSPPTFVIQWEKNIPPQLFQWSICSKASMV